MRWRSQNVYKMMMRRRLRSRDEEEKRRNRTTHCQVIHLIK